MTETQERGLKALERDIKSLGPRQKHLNKELGIIDAEIHACHAASQERKQPARIIIARWKAVTSRFDHYRADFAKFSRKLDSLRTRLDAIDKAGTTPEEIATLTEVFTALLDGSHRLKITIQKLNE